MSRLANYSALILAAMAAIGLPSNAHALLAVQEAQYGGGLYGTEAVTTLGGFSPGTLTAGGASIVSSVLPLDSGTLAASANLSSGVLTAYAAGGYASASEWDTFTFTGLPAGGATITASLSVNGLATGEAGGFETISAGPSGSLFGAATVSQSTTFDASAPATGSIAVQFTATNSASITVYSQIEANAPTGSVADLTDPPTLTIDLPTGVTATSASGVYNNFQTASDVPEPASAALLLTGVAALARLRPSRRTLRQQMQRVDRPTA